MYEHVIFCEVIDSCHLSRTTSTGKHQHVSVTFHLGGTEKLLVEESSDFDGLQVNLPNLHCCLSFSSVTLSQHVVKEGSFTMYFILGYYRGKDQGIEEKAEM